MIGLTSETTDEVSFGRRDQHLHLCPQRKQVWQSILRKPAFVTGNVIDCRLA